MAKYHRILTLLNVQYNVLLLSSSSCTCALKFKPQKSEKNIFVSRTCYMSTRTLVIEIA